MRKIVQTVYWKQEIPTQGTSRCSNVLCPTEEVAGSYRDFMSFIYRNHYRCTVLASRLMVARRSGLIVMVSSPGGLKYLFNVAYGVGKAAVRSKLS